MGIAWEYNVVWVSFSVSVWVCLFCLNIDLPISESTPQASHIIKLTPTEPVLASRPEGDTNIPDPTKKKRKNINKFEGIYI